MKNVLSEALGIEHYWGRVEFAPGRGQIHLHMLGIAKNKAYLNDFYKAKSMEDKAAVVDKYAREKLDMTADVNIKDDDRNYFPVHSQYSLSRIFCKALTPFLGANCRLQFRKNISGFRDENEFRCYNSQAQSHNKRNSFYHL